MINSFLLSIKPFERDGHERVFLYMLGKKKSAGLKVFYLLIYSSSLKIASYVFVHLELCVELKHTLEKLLLEFM